MSIEMTARRSRRAVLAAAAGAAAAAVAAGIETPTVRALDPNDVVLGGISTSGTTTLVQNTTTAEAALKGRGTTGDGVVGESSGDNKSGVYGFSWHDTGYGVFGRNKSGSGYGVGADGDTGVYATGTFMGVLGVSQNIGVRGNTSPGAGSGVCGSCYGAEWAYDAIGQLGKGDGTAVHGWSRAGTAIQAETGTSTATALNVVGRASFSRSGRSRIAAGARMVDVNLTAKGGLAGAPLILATLQFYRSGIYVAGVRPNYPKAGWFRIYLNKALTSATYVAWFVLG